MDIKSKIIGKMKNHFTKILLLLFILISTTNYSQIIEANIIDSALVFNKTKRVIALKKDSLKKIKAPIFRSPNYKEAQESYTIKEVPNPKKGNANGYISDPNDYISIAKELELNTLIWSIEQTTTAQIAIVVLPSIGKEVPKNFAVKIVEEWKIGQAEKDNGLLILTVIDQRRTEFETGYGLESILTDAICFRIGKQEIVPHFKKGNYGEGLIAAIKKVKLFLEKPEAIQEIYSNGITHEKNTLQNRIGIWYDILLGYIILSLLFFAIYFGFIYDIDKSINDYHAKYIRLEKFKIGFLLILFPLPFIYMNRLVKKRLKKYRFAPRYSRINGKRMLLKDEWAENNFLEKAQILEEKLNSVRYDVWVTEDESDILILEYKGANLSYSDCTKCSYKTFGKLKTVVITTATYNRSGKRLINYKCRNCNYEEEVTEIIPQKIQATSSTSSFGGSSSSFGGGSSSFGGGSSGGGGAGVSW